MISDQEEDTMKRKQLWVVGVALVLAVFLTAPAHAALTWVYANVVETGPGQGVCYVKLKVVALAFPYTPINPVTNYYKLYQSQQQEMMAVALTSLLNRNPVLVYVDYITKYSTVLNFYAKDSLPTP
jgi:hypothetical protein